MKAAKGRHVVLLVEDDDVIASYLGGLLAAMGLDHVHVTNVEDARTALEAGSVCLVLLDLQIKPDSDSAPYVEAGLRLLGLIRELFPHRTDRCHHLPVLVMSGHAKEAPDITEVFLAGADDFVVKPLSENRPPLKDKLVDALRRSGREKHDHCPAVTLRARATEAARESGSGRVTLAVKGTKEKKRFHILLDGKPVAMKRQTFLMVLRLVATRLRGKEVWLPKYELDPAATVGHKGPSRLMEDLAASLPSGVRFYDNDSDGGYRLHSDIDVGEIDQDTLDRHSEVAVQELAAQIRQLRLPRKG